MKPERIITQWMKMVNERNISGVLHLYDRQSVILPTFSDRIQDTPSKKKEYFRKLLHRRQLSISIHPRSIRTHAIGPTSHVVSGLYRWKFDVEGELITYEARFTFVVDSAKSAPIVHHHSSQIPRMV
ncbi:nuclear transport factor 2 family protein [bacterium]|nr:nuclear transport factor 2 family protein [bacterium]